MLGKVPFREIRDKLRELAKGDYHEFLQAFRSNVRAAQASNQRRMVVLCGGDDVKLSGLSAELVIRYLKLVGKRFKRKGKKVRVLYFHHDEFPEALLRAKIVRRVLKHFVKSAGLGNVDMELAVYEKSIKYLGTTVQVLVLDLLNDLRPNDIGRLLGIVEGGGIIVLLTPPHDKWPRYMTLFKQSLAVPNHPEPRHVFISWFLRHLYSRGGVLIYDVDSCRILRKGDSPEGGATSPARRELRLPQKKLFPEELYRLSMTQDQVNVIEAIEDNLVERFREFTHQVIVVIADRGRGKSSAVGIGVVGLIGELLKFKNRVRVAVTANEPSSVQSLMSLAIKALEVLGKDVKVIKREDFVIEIKGDRFSIEYWPPLEVLKLNVDVVVVDEAAGIPVPLLHKIWRKFRRTIFSTTIHGYEGAGRGFSVRFLKRIREDKKTKLAIVEMSEPIRYSADDPIEKFQFDVLLLNAEPAELTSDDLEAVKRGEYVYVSFDPEELFKEENEEVLRQIFGIYVLAHYRNEPDDLGMLADAPHHSIRAMILKNGKVVAAAQLAEEGGLSDEYVEELLKGGKIAGNIIPDRLLKHLRRRIFGRGIGWRVVRIAVHIDSQGLGIGSAFIRKIVEEATTRGYDWVGAGFGVTYDLLNFWLKNGFKVLHISPDRNPVSGEYTALVIHPLSDEWKKAVYEALEDFIVKFVECLPAVYRDFESDAAYLILSSVDRPLPASESIRMRETQIDRLSLYVSGVFTLEVVFDAALLLLKKLVFLGKISFLGQKDGQLLVARILQGKPWETMSEEFNIGKVTVANMVRNALAKAFRILESNTSN